MTPACPCEYDANCETDPQAADYCPMTGIVADPIRWKTHYVVPQAERFAMLLGAEQWAWLCQQVEEGKGAEMQT